MPKPRMKKELGIESPGMADCQAMGEELPDLIQEDEEIIFEDWG